MSKSGKDCPTRVDERDAESPNAQLSHAYWSSDTPVVLLRQMCVELCPMQSRGKLCPKYCNHRRVQVVYYHRAAATAEGPDRKEHMMASMIRRHMRCVVLCAGITTVAVSTSLAINAACLVCINNGFRPQYPDQVPTQTPICRANAPAVCTTCSPAEIRTTCATPLFPYRPSWLDRILIPFI